MENAKIRKRMRVFHKTGGRCAYCGISLDKSRFTLDHIIPRCKGGTDDIVNLVPCCESCNKRKWDKDLTEFLPIIGCLLDSYREYKNAGRKVPA